MGMHIRPLILSFLSPWCTKMRLITLGMSLYLVIFLGFVHGAMDSPDNIIDIDFFKGDVPMVTANADGKAMDRVTGQIPGGWKDDSAWAKAWVNYQMLDEEGQHYLAMKVGKIDSGYPQLATSLPNFSSGSAFKLTLKVRGTVGLPVELKVRMEGAPYQALWSTTFNPEGAWHVYEFPFVLTGNTQPMGLYIAAHGVGELDVGQLKLEKISHDQLVAEAKEQYPDGGLKNLLRDSRLPLGLQSGWTVMNEWTTSYSGNEPDGDPVIKPMTNEVGISGFPPLHVVSKDRAMCNWFCGKKMARASPLHPL